MKLSDYVIQRVAEKVDTVFFVPGGGAMHLVDSLGKSDMQAVSMLHEQGAAFAAQSYSMYHGFGVCLVTSGPGATNVITGVAAAWMDSYPLMVISGQAKTDTLKRDMGIRSFGSQEVGIVTMVESCTKDAYMILDQRGYGYRNQRGNNRATRPSVD
jgi:acetolactate synthase-1/2/3 large subunit